ncbi:sigma E regulatory protein, MucB/RseB [Blastococcus aurantiacus]|uniref:Sigma E regulatory protein, MucB/RseB n=1 Tax=Blastococcus aurantiacus TaxID=1550231 RepID=A0A1G7LZN2_9ACTN|nr:transcriptional regulator [Blastococcus aurantiacus]SDF54856.1 sigma E regulatory protein, MucB/RseB [Blastococcus aurantiacus]
MSDRGRAAAPRWAAVGVLVAVLVSLPAVVGALPVEDADVFAPDLRAAVLASDSVGYSGYAESAGGLALPVTDQLTSVADLFSDRTTMRVWWRGPADHRVDVVTTAGETGVHRDAGGSWTWEYERATATRTEAAPLELPAAPDLLPPSLGRRLLSEAADAELTRIGARRVAGRDALGLRLEPAAPAASVRRVDVWVDGDSGLPVQVEVVAKGSDRPALDTRFLDLELAVPPAEVTAFRPPPGATARNGRQAEVLREAGDRVRPVALPPELAGLPRRVLDGAPRGIGLYGSGVTLLAVAPVPEGLARALDDTLAQSPDAVVDDAGARIAAGPVGLMLVEPPGRGPYVLTGTVTLDALVTAAGQLPELAGTG